MLEFMVISVIFINVRDYCYRNYRLKGLGVRVKYEGIGIEG